MTFEELQTRVRMNVLKLKGNMTIAELARRSGLSSVSVSRTLSGKQNMDFHTVFAFAEGLEVDIEELVKKNE